MNYDPIKIKDQVITTPTFETWQTEGWQGKRELYDVKPFVVIRDQKII